nr:hypothetical protein GCM10020241_52940 [Streptoalloteichus tenebrarius]
MARGQRLRDNRDFRLWWGGTVVSSLGDEITIVAFPLVILLLTGSPLHAGLVGAVEAVPPLALALPIGVLVDRTSRRALLVGSAAVSMVSITSVALAFLGGEPALPHLYAVAFVNSLASTVYRIADTAALPRIVGRDQLGTAAGQNEAIWGVSAVTAPPLAGLLFEWAPAAPFLVDAATFAVVAGCVLGIRTRLGADRPYPSVRWRRDLTTGARTVLRQPTVRALTLLTVVGDVLFAGIGLLMIVLVREHGASAAQTGLVLAAPAVGSILGSLLASRLEDRLGPCCPRSSASTGPPRRCSPCSRSTCRAGVSRSCSARSPSRSRCST